MSLRPSRTVVGLCILCVISFTLFGISAVRAAGGNDGQPDIAVGVFKR